MDLQHKYESGMQVYTHLPRWVSQKDVPAIETPEDVDGKTTVVYDHNSVHKHLNEGEPLDHSTITYLMEALGEVAPCPADDGPLLRRLDAAINDTLNKLDEKSPLVLKLKTLKEKLDYFYFKSKRKREESLAIMQDVISRNNRYEDNQIIAPQPELIRQLFVAMNDVLRADKDMRTGRGLLVESNDTTSLFSNFSTNLDNCKENKCHGIAQDEETNSPTSVEIPQDSLESRKKEESEETKSGTWKSWLYSVFIETPSGLFKSKSQGEDASSENSKSKANKSSNDKPESEENNDDAEEKIPLELRDDDLGNGGSFWYYVYGWLVWPPVVKGESTAEVKSVSSNNIKPNLSKSSENKTTLPEKTNIHWSNNIESNYSDDSDRAMTSESSSWLWLPVTATYKSVAWVFSVLTNSKFS